jgi:hypothetical protein
MRRHVILLKLKDETTQEQIDDIAAGFRGMQPQIPGMSFVTFAPNISEGPRKRYDYVMTMDFETYAAYRAYEDSELHDRMVAEKLVPVVASITGADYDIGETPRE